MKIENYTCDLCGSIIPNLDNIEQVKIEYSTANYNKTFTYYVCPFCASVCKKLSHHKIEKILCNELQSVINKK